jgi:hypothetical protein
LNKNSCRKAIVAAQGIGRAKFDGYYLIEKAVVSVQKKMGKMPRMLAPLKGSKPCIKNEF